MWREMYITITAVGCVGGVVMPQAPQIQRVNLGRIHDREQCWGGKQQD